VTIGRGGGCAVPLTFDTFVSQVHARAFDREGTLWVEDAGSTNGTLVNSKRISQPMKLRKGDRVQVGETVLEARR
jgi:pSer/pThr/pTyr-binding forkhead associated (FHA) protein